MTAATTVESFASGLARTVRWYLGDEDGRRQG